MPRFNSRMISCYSELLNGCKAYLLPTSGPIHNNGLTILNKTFEAWSRTWQEVAATTQYTFKVDDFYRQNVVLSILSPKDEVMGCHLYSFFDLQNDCNREFSFFRSLSEEVKNHLFKNDLRNSFSIEYLTVDKKFRGHPEISMGRLVLSLSAQIFARSQFDALLAVSRDDVGVNRLCMENGAYPLANQVVYGLPSTSLIYEKEKLKPSPNLKVKELVSAILKRTQNLSNMNINLDEPIYTQDVRIA